MLAEFFCRVKLISVIHSEAAPASRPVREGAACLPATIFCGRCRGFGFGVQGLGFRV